MSSGKYRDYLRLLIPPGTDDGRGGQSGDWTDGHLFFGHVRAATAREQAIAGAIQNITTHVVETHFDSRIATTRRLERVAPTGTNLQIVGVRDEDGRQRVMLLDCTEVI